MRLWLPLSLGLGVTSSVGPFQCQNMQPSYVEAPALEPIPWRRVDEPPQVEPTARVRLSIGNLESILRWHAFSEVSGNEDDDELAEQLKEVLAATKRAHNLSESDHL